MTTEYDAKIAELERAETELRLQRRALEQLRAESLCPFKIGEVLTDKRGVRAILKRIYVNYNGYAMDAARLRKDGSEGRMMRLNDWDNWGKV